jgi:lipopolysaccharide/colanic/teichoic acid biosynthesis glycosyltransferase
MHIAAEQLLAGYLPGNAELRWEWQRDYKLRHDPRITPFGCFLRKRSLQHAS